MKNKTLTALGIGACAAACAAGLLVPALMAGGAAGLAGWLSFSGGADLVLCVAAAAIIAGAVYLLIRRSKAAACGADASCGCAPAPDA